MIHKNGTQLWWCSKCQRKQSGKDALLKLRYPSDQIATALWLYYSGLLAEKVRGEFEAHYKTHVAITILYEWLQEFTNEAIVPAIILSADAKLALAQSEQEIVITKWKWLCERINEFELSEFAIGFPSGIKIKFVRKHND